jgi:hypothetical protein
MATAKQERSSVPVDAKEFIWEVADDAGEPLAQVNFLHAKDETDDGSPSWRATLYPRDLPNVLNPHVFGGDLTRLGAFRRAMKNYREQSSRNPSGFPAHDWMEIEAALTIEGAFGP